VVVMVVKMVMMPMMMVMVPVIGDRCRTGVRNDRHNSEYEKCQQIAV